MSAVALHPSAITFVCPPWCHVSREGHLDDLGHFEGRCFHRSPDRRDNAAGWAVALSSESYPDGTPCRDGDVRVNIEVPDCDLRPPQARRLVQAIITATAEAER